MRDLFDLRLTDPTATELAAALRDALEAANANHKTGNLPAFGSTTRQIAARVRNEPQGMNGYFGRAYGPANVARISLGWWTNANGRKLVRVRGWRERSLRDGPGGWQTEAFVESERDRHRRPGVWHVDHERILEARSGPESEWVAVCGCGAVGSVDSLGWQEGMCGPCADRIAEFGPNAVTHSPGLLADADFEPQDVAFTPDGRFVIAVGPSRFRIWDAATGALKAGGTHPELLPEVRPATSPDGRFVIFARSDVYPLLIDLAGSRNDTLIETGEIRAAHATGRPDEFLFQMGNSRRRLQLANAADGILQPEVEPPESGAILHAVRPDAARPWAVFASGHRVWVSRIERDGALAVESRFLLGNGALNRTGLWQAGPNIGSFTPDGERLLFVRGQEMELWHPAKPKALLQATFPEPIKDAAFSPDYEHLFILGADGAVSVCNPGTLTSVRARFRWHVGPVSRLAVSPDGQTLATAGFEGVKLWPVGRLLPILG